MQNIIRVVIIFEIIKYKNLKKTLKVFIIDLAEGQQAVNTEWIL